MRTVPWLCAMTVVFAARAGLQAGMAAGSSPKYVRLSYGHFGVSPSLGPVMPYRALLGSDRDRAIVWGLPSADGSVRMWTVAKSGEGGAPIPVLRYGLLAISRGCSPVWLAFGDGLALLSGGEVRQLPEVQIVHRVGMGELGPAPPPEPWHGDFRCGGMVLDVGGAPWVISVDNQAVGVFAGTGPVDDPKASWYYTEVLSGNLWPVALCGDGGQGVWVYGLRKDAPRKTAVGGLVHLSRTGSGKDLGIAVVAETGVDEALPHLDNVKMTTTTGGGAIVAGQANGETVLIEATRGGLRKQTAPAELMAGCSITALAAASDGDVLAATSGAGILISGRDGWRTSGLTENLPVVWGTELHEVDDLLLSNEGVLYAACHGQVVMCNDYR